MNLRALLEARLAFDKAAAIDQAKHEDSDGYFGFLTGSEWQSDRLKPIHDALIELVDEISKAKSEFKEEGKDYYSIDVVAIYAALANLEKLLREGTDDRP